MYTTVPATSPPAPLRPRARGWIHFYSAAVAVVGSLVMIPLAAVFAGPGPVIACTVYCLTLVGLFTISATYHRRVWTSPRTRTVMKRADHSMIFVFIAGSCTPIAGLALSPPTSTTVLVAVWTGAAGGVGLKMRWPHAPRWVGVPIYLALGWVAVPVLPELQHNGGTTVLLLITVGGLIYTIGAVIYAIRRPNTWPAAFGYHEYFHACVTTAAFCQWVAIWLLIFRAV